MAYENRAYSHSQHILTFSLIFDRFPETHPTANALWHKKSTFTFIHFADTFIQSDLQLLYMSEIARL